jgi:hypothetical protein
MKNAKLKEGYDCRGQCRKSWLSVPLEFQQRDDGDFYCECGGIVMKNLVYPPECEDYRKEDKG